MIPPALPIGTAAITENLLKRKWSTIVLRYLETGLNDPVEISQREPDISPLAMNDRLRTMVRYQLIEKIPRGGPAAKVTYRITVRGRNILKILEYIALLDQVPANDQRSLEELLGSEPTAMPPKAGKPRLTLDET